ncbi:MAG: ClpXP protease specificity-enhancing factor SspB [Alphaproteobacteria bacterium]
MKKIFIDYGERINQAILNVIKEILKDLSESKISSNHCFYITFKTNDPKVDIPNNLKKEYPNEMTIVLQNQYWNLEVKKMNFSVTLSFNKKKQILNIPFNSITKFYDPFVKFSIQLDLKEEKKKANTKNKEKKPKKKSNKIITLDDFRKKND